MTQHTTVVTWRNNSAKPPRIFLIFTNCFTGNKRNTFSFPCLLPPHPCPHKRHSCTMHYDQRWAEYLSDPPAAQSCQVPFLSSCPSALPGLCCWLPLACGRSSAEQQAQSPSSHHVPQLAAPTAQLHNSKPTWLLPHRPAAALAFTIRTASCIFRPAC